MERPVFSLEEVLKRFGNNCDFYITLGEHNWEQCYHYLLNRGINANNIKFFGEKEYRLGCDNLNYYCYVQSRDVRVCAHYPYAKSFYFDNNVISEIDLRQSLYDLEEWRNQTIHLISKEQSTSCDGCSALRYGIYDKKPSVKTFAVGPKFAGSSICNCDCFYCSQQSTLRSQSDQVLSNYDIHRICADVYKGIEHIILADGEPTIISDIDKLFDLICERNWSVNFNTNAIIYKDNIARAIAKNRQSILAVSLDSGTSETYKKIKRIDAFEKVVANLYKYKNKGCQIILKYILLPGYNDNIEDMNEFINIAKELNAINITLSQNLSGIVDGVNKPISDMQESTYASFVYLISRVLEEEMSYDFQIEFITKHDFERFEKLRLR